MPHTKKELIAKIVACWWLLFITCTAAGRSVSVHPQPSTPTDSVILFRFVPGQLMSYSPFRGNEESIRKVHRLINLHRHDILSGHAYVAVRGYCSSFHNEKANRRAARNRANQVKSYFITNGPLKEQHYRTHNYTCAYLQQPDVVAVIGIEYAGTHRPLQPAAHSELTATLSEAAAPHARGVPHVHPSRLPQNSYLPPAPCSLTTAPPKYAARTEETKSSPWYLKSNLLYDACLLPSLEVEYRLNSKWSVATEANIAWWHNSQRHKYYQLSTITPEVRYWPGTRRPRRGHYIGLLTGGGWYDLENGKAGYKGEGWMTAISYGYLFPVGRHLALEAGVALGYMRSWYEKYQPKDGHYVYMESKRLDYFGPLRLRLALVWNLPWFDKRKGGAL